MRGFNVRCVQESAYRYHNSIHPSAQCNPANYEPEIHGHGEAIYAFIALNVETGVLPVDCET